ncbi:MAG: hypothetical protein JO341_03955 [Gammaproteobacteria bacterium]|nr:hypothetical protein [Gammaproteobacteria bacterium]
MSAIPLQALFAVPFASVPLALPPELNSALAPWLLEQATDANHDPAYPADALCFRGRETLFQGGHPGLATLRSEILSALCGVVMAASRLSASEFDKLAVQVRGRLLLVRPNGCLAASNLPLASWCALYCVAAPAPTQERADSAMLRLYEARMGGMFLDASNAGLRPPFHPGHHLWRPVAGHLAVFPAAIMHEIALNRGDRELMLIQARVRFAHPEQELPAW